MFHRTSLLTLILVSFLALTILGAPQAAQMKNHNASCIASAMNGAPVPCPSHNLLGFINFHLDAFKNFSRAISQTDFILLLLLLLFFFVAYAPATLFLKRDSPLIFSLIPNNFSSSAFFENFIRWLAFHENSPNYFSLRRKR